jgi:predicted SprT family Zn-dependent metalloprotease
MSQPTLKALSEMFDNINEEHFNSCITKVSVQWNNRLRTCAGLCKFKRKRMAINGVRQLTPTLIELSVKLFKNNDWDIDKIKNTLTHEMCHAYLLEHYNERGHTQRFQDTMTRITGVRKNHRCHNYDVEVLKNEKKYSIQCPKHGEIGKRSRAPKRGGVYRCNHCKSVITFVKLEKKPDNFWGIGD